jgi:hypothetical protein
MEEGRSKTAPSKLAKRALLFGVDECLSTKCDSRTAVGQRQRPVPDQKQSSNTGCLNNQQVAGRTCTANSARSAHSAQNHLLSSIRRPPVQPWSGPLPRVATASAHIALAPTRRTGHSLMSHTLATHVSHAVPPGHPEHIPLPATPGAWHEPPTATHGAALKARFYILGAVEPGRGPRARRRAHQLAKAGHVGATEHHRPLTVPAEHSQRGDVRIL